jgi:cell division septation protein DedD
VYGTALYNGDGVRQDRLLGYAYISRAAQQGLSPAKETLSQLDDMMSDGDRRKALVLANAVAKSAPAKTSAASLPPVRVPKSVHVAQAKRQVPAPVASSPRAAPTTPVHGDWRIQLGAFAQRSSAEAMYERLAGKASIAGRSAVYVPAGSVTRLQVGPFATRAAAAAACRALGTACFPVPAK